MSVLRTILNIPCAFNLCQCTRTCSKIPFQTLFLHCLLQAHFGDPYGHIACCCIATHIINLQDQTKSLLALPLLPLDTFIYACMLIYTYYHFAQNHSMIHVCVSVWVGGIRQKYHIWSFCPHIIVKQALHEKGLSNHVKPTPSLVFETLQLETASMQN